ncbi:MAG: FtsW/RodA/SpoVE family cell cycle protein [Oscillospiraceae bacterium]|nr:FtsW/RodA/SpoVE family cell cycle protein [Oscillospiraceae bacterium]
MFDFDIFEIIVFLSRFVLPLLAVTIVARAAASLLRERAEPELWGTLSFSGGLRLPLTHWENVIGRSVSSDVALKYPTLSRTHAALIRDARGLWRVHDLKSTGGVTVDGREVPPDGYPVHGGSIIGFGGITAVFFPAGEEAQYLADGVDYELTDYEEIEEVAPLRRPIRSGFTLALLTEFQLLLGVAACCSRWETLSVAAPISFALLIALTWGAYALTRVMRRRGFELETLAFLLCSVGLAVTCSSAPSQAIRQMLLLAAGLALYFSLGWFLRDLGRAKKLRWPIAGAGLALLAVNIALGGTVFGAKNWLQVGGFSFQPSEFVKIALIFAGAATLDRLFARRNLIMFIGFAGACVGALALMSDFGTALVFFTAYLVIAFLRSGDFATVFLSVAGAAFGGFLAVLVKDHVAARFSNWLHAWENVSGSGYQQTRAMAAAASGGLFGVGAGAGWLHRVFAADTDLVFGMVCEELGLIAALAVVAAIVVISVFPVRSSERARSSFYVIAACAAGAIFLIQSALNILGSVDILPFTGVTLPFVSKGGSSLMACWGLLAFIKASDTRKGASFVVKAERRAR